MVGTGSSAKAGATEVNKTMPAMPDLKRALTAFTHSLVLFDERGVTIRTAR